MSARPNFIVKLLKGELRTAIALGVLLLVLVGLSLAAGTAKYKFDFGEPGQGVPSGYTAVNGSVANWPQQSGAIQYGWVSGEILTQSAGATVSDLLKRDSNFGVGKAQFKLNGIDSGFYTVSITSGDQGSSFSTTVTAAGRSYQATTQPNHWETLTFGVSVTEGELDFAFASGAQAWGINALTLTPTASPPPIPTFDMQVQPAEHTIRIGGTVIYKISLTPLYGYASSVNISVNGMVENMTAQLIPASIVPPGTVDLRIATSDLTIPTSYNFIVNATGTDPGAVSINQSISLVVTDSPYLPVSQPEDLSEPAEFSDSQQQLIDDIHSRPPNRAETQLAQAKIDEFVQEVQEKKLATPTEIGSVDDIATINAFPVIEELPIPDTTLEAALLRLTKADIIKTVVDTAPPASAALLVSAKSVGFWEGFLSKLFNASAVY